MSNPINNIKALETLDSGPWSQDPETELWVTLDGRIAKPGFVKADGVWQRTSWRKQYFDGGYMRQGSQQAHRIIARAWVDNPNPGKFNQVNHIDGNKINNLPENLEWIDSSGNLRHAYATGLRKKKRTPELEERIKKAIASGKKRWGAKIIAAEFGVSTALVQTIANEYR